MDYVCKVVGTLKINDINLSLGHLEIVNLNQDDFKQSPRLRIALKNREIEIYNPQLHKKARRFKIRPLNIEIPSKMSKQSSKKEIEEIHISLSGVYKKMDSLVNRINILISHTVESSNKLNDNFDKFFKEKAPENNKLLNKLDNFFRQTEEKSKKNNENFEKLITKIDELISKGINVSGGGNGKLSTLSKKTNFDDNPIFIPDLDTKGIKTNIVTEEIESEGTKDILEKLKNMK